MRGRGSQDRGARARAWLDRELAELRAVAPRGGHRVVVTVVLITVAYHYSLLTLVRSLNLETPLAYLGLVPFMALLLVGAKSVDRRAERSIHDRQLDYIVGLPLMGAAMAINLLMPARLSTMFWVWRVDLLSLPLFTAGAVALVFGVRALWRLRLPVGFLFLAWPLPYTLLLVRFLDSFTALTVAGLRAALKVVPVAQPAPGAAGSLFAVGTGSGRFTLSVASACAGVNGLVGFLLVSVAFIAVVRGPRLRKGLWLALGLVLIWLLNVARIVAIFAAGRWFGEGVAIDGLHPYLGLVTFNLGVLAMVLAMGRFGLSLRPDLLTRHPQRRPRPPAVRSARPAVAVVAVLAVLCGSLNAGLRSYDRVAGDLGSPRLAAFTQQPLAPSGWSVRQSASYPWGRRYFGDRSSWLRFVYSAGRTARQTPLRSPGAPVFSDVISTPDFRTLSTYGVEACYRFHNYKLRDTRDIALGGGVVGRALSYYNPKLRSDWTTVYWHWPVRTSNGTRYERVTLMLVAGAGGLPPGARITDSARRLLARQQSSLGPAGRAQAADRRLATNRGFLTRFATTLIADAVSAAGHAPPPSRV